MDLDVITLFFIEINVILFNLILSKVTVVYLSFKKITLLLTLLSIKLNKKNIVTDFVYFSFDFNEKITLLLTLYILTILFQHSIKLNKITLLLILYTFHLISMKK